MVIAYIRISTNKQDTDTQLIQIKQYCKDNDIDIDEVMRVQESSRKTQEKRRINELKDKLTSGDIIIVSELSRLGRSMLEVIKLVKELAKKEVDFIFLRQPELSSFKNPII